MKIKNMGLQELGSVIRRLKLSDYIDDDGDNYIISKTIFKSAQNGSKDAGERSVQRFDEKSAPMLLIELLKAWKEAYKNVCKQKYVSMPNDWALLRALARKFGTNECAEKFEHYFQDEIEIGESVDEVGPPSIQRFHKFMQNQEKLGNIEAK